MPLLAAVAAVCKGGVTMAEYTAAALQTVDADQNILFTDAPVPCTRGWVVHRNGSGVFTLRGLTDKCSVVYHIAFLANAALPAAATPAPITLGLAVNGEVLRESLSIFTPAAAEDFGNIPVMANVRVPRGCCVNVSIVNATTPDAPVDIQNANIEITRTA